MLVFTRKGRILRIHDRMRHDALNAIERLARPKIRVTHAAPRCGDQYACDRGTYARSSVSLR